MWISCGAAPSADLPATTAYSTRDTTTLRHITAPRGQTLGLRWSECAGEELADPAHALGGGLRVVAEFLCHKAGAATDAELPHRGPDRFGHGFGGWRVGLLQTGGEQCPAPGVVNVELGHGGSPHRVGGVIRGCVTRQGARKGIPPQMGRSPRLGRPPLVAGQPHCAPCVHDAVSAAYDLKGT